MIILIFYILISILRFNYIFHPSIYNEKKYTHFYNKLEKITKDKKLIRNITVNYDNNIEIDLLYIINPLSSSTVFICPGNFGNMSYRYYLIDFWYTFSSVIIFDYPCFGKSNYIKKYNKLNIENIDKYTLSIWNYCENYLLIKSENTIILGENIGCYCASKLVNHLNQNVKTLILHSPFININTYLKNRYDYIGIIYPSFMFTDEYNMTDELKIINKINVYLIHSDEDEIIPYSEIEKLYKLINKNNFILIPIKGKNNNLKITDKYLYTLEKYCE